MSTSTSDLSPAQQAQVEEDLKTLEAYKTNAPCVQVLLDGVPLAFNHKQGWKSVAFTKNAIHAKLHCRHTFDSPKARLAALLATGRLEIKEINSGL